MTEWVHLNLSNHSDYFFIPASKQNKNAELVQITTQNYSTFETSAIKEEKISMRQIWKMKKHR